MGKLLRNIRLGCKALRLAGTLAIATLDGILSFEILGRFDPTFRSIPSRARWMQQQCRRLLGALAIEASYRGDVPEGGVLVCNHLSYTDILILGARTPSVFVSKAEVAPWPVFGMLSKAAGTL